MGRLTDLQKERYSRNIQLEPLGMEGQLRLLEAAVLVIGVGGIGSSAALYSAAAGVGTIGLVDADAVELSNLQRQIIHCTKDVGYPKVLSAKEKLNALNPDVTVRTARAMVDVANVQDIVTGYDFVIDATDGLATKLLVNDACVSAGIPYSHGGVERFSGEAMTVLPGKTACYRCVFPAADREKAAGERPSEGVLGAAAGLLGAIQAAEAVKVITGAGEILADELLAFDVLRMDFRKVKLKRNPKCAVCSRRPSG